MCGQPRVLNLDLDANTDEEVSTEDEMEMQDITDITSTKEAEDGLTNYFTNKIISKEVDYCSEKSYDFVDNKSSHFKDKKCYSDFIERKACNSDKLLTDSKTNIKVIKTESKKEESKFSEPMASTSKSELKSDDKFVKNDNQIKLRTVEMKDVSTESRYVYRPKLCTPPKADVPQSSNSIVEVSAPPPPTVSPLVTTTATIKKIWDYICKKCSDSLESRRDFNEHFIRFHSKQNLPQIYTKIEKSREPTLSAKHANNLSKNRSKKLKKSTSLPSHPIPTHSSSLSSKVKDNRNKKSKHKHKKRSKSKSGHSKESTVTVTVSGQSSQPSEQPLLTTNYRLVQKCKVCSFTPLVNSMEAIRDHIRNEHHIHFDLSLYYSDFLVKMTPKKP